MSIEFAGLQLKRLRFPAPESRAVITRLREPEPRSISELAATAICPSIVNVLSSPACSLPPLRIKPAFPSTPGKLSVTGEVPLSWSLAPRSSVSASPGKIAVSPGGFWTRPPQRISYVLPADGAVAPGCQATSVHDCAAYGVVTLVV